MSHLRALGRSIPRSYVRFSSDMIRRIRLRRRWPRPDHFARMSPVQIESYIRSIGFDEEIRQALAEHDGGRPSSERGLPRIDGEKQP